MSVHSHRGRVIPTCRTCRDEADHMVAHPNGDAYPYCFPCGNAALEDSSDGRTYPLEEYYTTRGDHCSSCDPHDEPVFELFDPDNDEAYLFADNGKFGFSSVNLAEHS